MEGDQTGRRSLWVYLRLRLTAAILRSPFTFIVPFYKGWNRIGFLPSSQSIAPVRTEFVQSSRSSRKIKVLVHEPPNFIVDGSKPMPVHLNFHGSGFVYPALGCDAELCTYIAENVNCIVLDCDYVKGPEHPFPGAHYDAVDILTWVQSQPERFSTITIGGQSAGGNLALTATGALPEGSLKAITVLYPPTDFTRRGWPDEKRYMKPFAKGTTAGVALGKSMRTFFTDAYLLPGADNRDPRLSPAFMELKKLPPTLLIVGDRDTLCKEGVAFVDSLKDAGVHAELMLISDAGHSWERYVNVDIAKFGPVRVEVFERIVKDLKENHFGAS